MVTTILLFSSLAVFACVFAGRISDRIGLPSLLIFILLGMVFGEDGLLRIPFSNYGISETICSVGLIFIMFYGGFGTRWAQAKSIAVKAITLSTAGTVLTAIFIALLCRYVLHFTLMEGLLIGAVLCSTDAASVFSVLRSRRLNLKENTASVLEVESGSNDPFSYMLTFLVLSQMADPLGAGETVLLLVKQIGFGLGIGAVSGLIALLILKRYPFSNSGIRMCFVMGIAVFSYAFASFVDGNGYLSTYLCGILLGNSDYRERIPLVHFFNGITGLMQIMIFFLLGFLATPSVFGQIWTSGLLIFLGLTFIARPLAVFLLLGPQRSSLGQMGLVSWSGLRGAASIVFAIMATLGDQGLSIDVFHITFFVVLLSITFQGSLLPWAAKKLKMIDDSQNVLTTFSDYADDENVQFLKISITKDHPWLGRTISSLTLPPQTLAALIIRHGQNIAPEGKTVLEENDTLVLTAPEVEDNVLFTLREVTLPENSPWVGKTVAQYGKKQAGLIIQIRRGEDSLMPRGDTVLATGDTLIIHLDNM